MRAWLRTAMVASVLGALAVPVLVGAAPAAALGRIVPGTPLPVTYLTQVDMQSFGSGLGIADVGRNLGGVHKGRQFVVATSDGGSSWRVVNAYVQRDGTFFDEPKLLVAPGGDLYADDRVDGTLWLSSDDAASWSRVAVAGLLDSVLVVGDALWVTADHCTGSGGGRSTCTTYLSVYALGSTTPSSVAEVPNSTSRDTYAQVQFPRPHEATLLAANGREGAVLLEGSEQPGPNALVATADGGATWRGLDDPCAGYAPGRAFHERAIPAGLFVAPSGLLTLYCTLDFGMNQGLNELFTSPNGGRGWRVLARDEVPGAPAVGDLDGLMAASFAMSHDGRCFWKVSTVGPETQSCDGGRRWASPPRDPNSILPSALDPVGPRGAFLVDITQGLWRTTDGVHWTLLR